jgi:hypothetical protein
MPFQRLRTRSERLQRTDLAGIPCFWAERPAPFTATLLFRTGRVDETLRSGGISHLTEHLAMPAEAPRDFERNARVENAFTVFWATGGKSEVLEFLAGTAGSLVDLPVHRLETERRILRTEAADNGRGPVASAMQLRYGPVEHGLVGYEELGLHWLGEEEVRSWSRERFTTGNAAIWMTGRPPKGLRFELPEGPRVTPQRPRPISDIAFPCVYQVGPEDLVAASFEVERSVAVRLAIQVLVARMWKVLRYEHGLAYSISDWYEPLTAEVAHAAIWVNCLPDNLDTVQARLLDLLHDLAEQGPTAEELGEEVRVTRRHLEDPFGVPSSLHYACCEELFGANAMSREELIEELEQVTCEDIASELARAYETMLLIVSPTTTPARELNPYPASSDTRIEGRRYRPRAFPLTSAFRSSALFVGADGVSVEADESRSTVRFEDCLAVLRWPGGSRGLWGRDGFYVHVDPTLWWRGRDAVQAVDAGVPSDRYVVVDPDLSAKTDAVEEAVREKLSRRWVVSDELRQLPEVLGDGESLLTLAEATRGVRAGLLVVTDRRLLWLYAPSDGHTLEFAHAELEQVRARRGLFGRKVVVRTRDGRRIKLGEIAPKRRAPEIERLVRERLDAAG